MGERVIGLPTDYQTFIATSRYARWNDALGRREYWYETVNRTINFFREDLQERLNFTLPENLQAELTDAILQLEVMPSMRVMMTAGEALRKNNIAAYNCSYLPIDHPFAFDEIMLILMHGTGVGFSVERQFVTQLPEVPKKLRRTETTIIVEDNKEGWSYALRQLLGLLWAGEIPKWDTSRVRSAGARLLTFGGRASGPEPLDNLFRFIVNKFLGAVGRKLSSLECHDIACKIGEVVVVGGVRRSAMISLSNLSDDRMRHAKSGQWWENEGQRSLANNSVAYTEKPDIGIFMEEWLSLYNSKSGERGFFNREAARKKIASIGRREVDYEFGCNPCSEILLRPYQFCNLSECVIRATDTEETLVRKIRLATLLGTIQSTLTSFDYLRDIWKSNTEEERLLGVSLTGIMDNPLTNGTGTSKKELKELLRRLRQVAIDANKEYAAMLGIPAAAAITCVKPSGTVSQLVDAASGIHARHSSYYIRTVRGDVKDPLTRFMQEVGIPNEPCFMRPDSTVVFSFPHKSPDGAITRNSLSAIEQLDLWLVYNREWCEHKPSVTISVREHEWMAVGAWCWEHFDDLSGISFLPHSDHSYVQAPYQDCTEDEYNALLAKMPASINWEELATFEIEDTTKGTQTLACSGGSCEIVDV